MVDPTLAAALCLECIGVIQQRIDLQQPLARPALPPHMHRERDELHKHDDPLASQRSGLGSNLQLARMQAYQRKLGEILCADIMSRDLVTAEFGTELEEAWAQLRYRKIKAIPVANHARRVSGMTSDKPEVLGQIMAAPVYTVGEDAHIAELVPLLSEKGLHHIPVVNAENRLVGMVTQSDLIGALYAGSAKA